MDLPSSGTRHELPATLVEMTARRLRDGILSGELKPGEKVTEELLSAQLGISRAPVREALRLLGEQGLVEHLPRRGSRVVAWSAADILELFELRGVLEAHAVRSALPLADPGEALSRVRTALDRMRAASGELARDDAHRDFHAAIVALAGKRQLQITLAPILLKLQLPMAKNLREEARRSEGDGIARHEELVRALESNDAEVVVEALRDHGHLAYLELPQDR